MKRPTGVAQPAWLAKEPTIGEKRLFISLYVSGFAIKKKTSAL